MSQIIVVDDEQEIRDLLKDVLQEHGHQVTTAGNGKLAKDLIKLEKPQLILSDIKMPEMNGLELLHWNKKELKIPIILMTGVEDIIEKQEALDIGASDFILKPFDVNQLLKSVDHFISDSKKIDDSPIKEDRFDDEKFCKMDLDRFVSGREIPCSIFIRIKKNHFVKLAEKGEPIPKAAIEKYRAKNLQFLYVLKDEFKELVGFNLKLLRAMNTKSKKIPKEKINNFLQYSTGVVLEQAYISGMDRDAFENSKDYASSAMEMLKDENSIMELLISLKEHSDPIYCHCLVTALYATMIAKEVGWHHQPTLFKVFMAGLFHDIGLKYSKKDVILANPSLLNDEDLQNLKSHPTRGMEILNGIEGIPEEVILAAYQHHEDCIGQGYPQGLRKSHISPISRLISVADIITDGVVRNKGGLIDDYRKALLEVEKYKKKHYDSEFFDAFKRVLKVN